MCLFFNLCAWTKKVTAEGQICIFWWTLKCKVKDFFGQMIESDARGMGDSIQRFRSKKSFTLQESIDHSSTIQPSEA